MLLIKHIHKEEIVKMQTPQSEDDFKRSKSKVVYQTTRTIVDKQTGEIIAQTDEQTVKTSTEPDYIKVYYKVMLAAHNIDELSLDFVLALSSVINYSNSPKEHIFFYNNKTNRRIIAELCKKKNGDPITDNMVSKYIKAAKDVGLLFDTKDRGTYEVNPWMIAKGKWANISKLQAAFTFNRNSSKWERIIELKENEQES